MPVASIKPAAIQEDPLEYLPRHGTTAYRKGQEISLPAGLHLVQSGRLKQFAGLPDYAPIVIEIYGAEGLLLTDGGERAEALDPTVLMSWTSQEIDALIECRPRLGIALLQVAAVRNRGLIERMQSLGREESRPRVRRSLLRLAERDGVRTVDGTVTMLPLTHVVLSEYIGTSREVVTFEMNRLRRDGVLKYSRKGIIVHTQALREALEATA